jgi:hypothetical protein
MTVKIAFTRYEKYVQSSQKRKYTDLQVGGWKEWAEIGSGGVEREGRGAGELVE